MEIFGGVTFQGFLEGKKIENVQEKKKLREGENYLEEKIKE